VSVARFVADQRTMYRVPHTVTCAILGISISWFHKWLHREPTERQRRRAALDARVRELFEASQGTYGSPRVHADLLEAGATVSVNTVADSMRRQGLQGRKPKRRRGLTRQDRSAPKFPDLVHRDFSAPAANVKWCGDITEIPTAWILSVVATRVIYACSSKAVNRSAGVSQPRVFRGRVLSCSATAWRSATL
jgi:putative transposase